MQVRVIPVEGNHFPKKSFLRFRLGDQVTQTAPQNTRAPKWNSPSIFNVTDPATQVLHVALIEEGKDEEYAVLDIPLKRPPEDPESFKMTGPNRGKHDPRVVLYLQMPYDPSMGEVSIIFAEKKHRSKHVVASTPEEETFLKLNPDGSTEHLLASDGVIGIPIKYHDSSDSLSDSSSSSSSGHKKRHHRKIGHLAGLLRPADPEGDVYPSSRTVIAEIAEEVDEHVEVNEKYEDEIPSLSEWSEDDEKLEKSLSEWSEDDEKLDKSLSEGHWALKEKKTTVTTTKVKQVRLLNDLDLHVKVVAAEKLPIADANGSTDGFCICKYGGLEKRTEVVQNDLNPVWNAAFTYNAGGAMDSFLEIKVFDKDPLHDDALGKVILPIKNMVVGKVCDEWIPMLPVIKLPVELETKLHVVYQLAEKEKTPFEEYKLECPVLNALLVDGSEEVNIGMNGLPKVELKKDTLVQLEVINMFEDKLAIALGDGSIELGLADLGLGEITEDDWDIKGTKVRLMLEIREKSAEPFTE